MLLSFFLTAAAQKAATEKDQLRYSHGELHKTA